MALVSKTRLRMALVVAGSMLAGGLMTGTAMAYQGHMLSALHALQTARNQLADAAPDKGGYRAQALGLVDQAIGAVNAGIQYGAQ